MKTITFYSYKGGVGRSLVLANLAQRLVEFGKSVCMLDFDLEAPGLPFKFEAEKILAMNKKGVVDFITEYQATNKPPQTLGNDYAILLNEGNNYQNPLRIITAGNTNRPEFWKTLAAIDWKNMFYSQQGQGVRLVLHLKALIEKELAPDYLLVDSRTGVTETSGIALSILADRIVIVAANNHENIYGSELIMKGLLNNPMPEAKPDIHFILSRVPFTKEPNARLKEKDRVDAIAKKFGMEGIEFAGSEIFLLHSNRDLEERERLKIRDFEDEESNEVFIGEDYRKIFRSLFVSDFNESEKDKFEKQEQARSLYYSSIKTHGGNVELDVICTCIELDPFSPSYYHARAKIWESNGDREAALKDYETALALDNSIERLFDTAYAYQRAQMHEKALSIFNVIIAREPIAAAFYWRSRSYLALDRLAESEADLMRAIELNFVQKDFAYLALADLKFKTANYQEALDALYISLELSPDYVETIYLLAKTYFKLGNIPEFYLNLERAVSKRSWPSHTIPTDEFFRPLLNEERFKRILYKYNIKMKLPEKPAEEK